MTELSVGIKIGSGGFANVFVSKSDGNKVLKQLRYELLGQQGLAERFKREFEITQSLQDIPGIIPVYEYYPENYSYDMMRCSLNLESYLDNYPLSDGFREFIIDTVLFTMEKVHNRGILHRDLSVSNILINIVHEKYYIYISDFGLGKDLDKNSTYKTQMTMGFGQDAFTAPEQLKGLKDATKQSDVYSLGKIINYIFTGSPDDTNHKYGSICDRATARTPHYRQSDAAEMRADIIRQKEINSNIESREKVLFQIQNKNYDEFLEAYLNHLDPLTLAEEIRDSSDFVDSVIWYINKNNASHEDSILRLMEKLKKNCQKVLRVWGDADNFSYLAYEILRNNEIKYRYEIKVCAAEILRWSSWRVGRFHGQRLIEYLENQGLEPAIESILKNN